MERKKTLILTILLLLIALQGQTQIKDSMRDKELFELFNAAKFSIDKSKTSIDSFYISYRRIKDESFCIANPNEKFNSTDLRESKYCNARLVLYGNSTNSKCLKVILYEEDHGGGPGKTCNIYKVEGFKVARLLSFFVPPTTKSIADIKSAIKNSQYTILESY